MFKAEIIADSVSAVTGKRLTTWCLQYPRFIHAELMTHRMLSKNAASSRAIPVQKVIDMVRTNPATPIHWGKNQPGMQANEELEGRYLSWAKEYWNSSAEKVANSAASMSDIGAHKQIVNRILEPFQWMKTVVTGTEWENFYWLRNHKDAQPEFKYLAELMLDTLKNSVPAKLYPGDWHTPYYGNGCWIDLGDGLDHIGSSLQDALNISMSCSAQVSYRTLDDTLEKAEKVVSRLNLEGANDDPVHASPSEHQATPMKKSKLGEWHDSVNLAPFTETWEDGITAYHKELGFMSGNFSGFIQNRQLIKGHCKW